MLPNHRAAAARRFGPSMTSGTSVMPNQLITATTFGIGGRLTGAEAWVGGAGAAPRAPGGGGGDAAPAQSRPRPALSGMIPIARARCPPADSPVTANRFASML